MPKMITNLAELKREFAMVSKPELNAKLYQALAGWENVKDLGALNVHPIVPGYRLLRLDERVKAPVLPTFEVVMLCDTTQQVVYYNRVVVMNISDLNIKPATQSLVWRSREHKHDTVLHKVAANVFTNYILNDYNAIVSDGNQTSGGKFFWEGQVSTAMHRGNNVYFYKMMSAELERIKDDDDFNLLKDFIWGDTAAFEQNLVIISKDELPLDRKYQVPMEIIEELDKTDIQKVVRAEQDPDLNRD
jgi:hypothetical protein